MKAQIKEIADYFDLDGIFFDMTFWLVVCRCKHCQARWENEEKHIDAVEEYVKSGGIFCFSGVESMELLQRFFGKDVALEGFAERMFNYIAPTESGKGKVVWWGVPLENYTDRQSRALLMQILSNYLPESERILVAEKAPMAELVVFKDENEWLVSAVNVGDAEDGRLVPDFKVKIKSEKAAKGVYLLPEKTPVPFDYEDGRIVFTVKDLDLFDMYLIEL